MKLCVIRHAESLANAASDLDNPTYYYDSKITERGVSQAKKLHNKIKDLSFDKYFCSPLTRTIETFSIIFPNHKPVFEPLIREHLYHSCDVGRQPKTLKKIFTNYDFSKLENYWWNNNIPINEKLIKQETHNDIRNRLIKFLLKIRNLDVNSIVLVSHGTYLSQITDYMMDNCEFYICNYDELCKKFSI